MREKTQDKRLATFPRKVCCTNILFCCNDDTHTLKLGFGAEGAAMFGQTLKAFIA